MAKVVILSGAGLSAESGIKTFRGHNGMWENYDVMEVCSAQGYANNPKLVESFYDARRKDIGDKQPNEAHYMITRIKNRYPDEIAVITQNVDDLLEKAECKDVIHLHGTLTDLRCKSCEEVFPVAYASQNLYSCPSCESKNIRHNVVMFGEMAPRYQDLSREIDDAQLLVVIGTSGQVIDSAYLAQLVGKAVLNNIDVDDAHDQYFQTKFYEPASLAALKIEEVIETFLSSSKDT